MSSTLRNWLFWTATGLATVVVVLIVTNALLLSGNRAIQVEVNARQRFINQSIQLSRLHQDLVNTLAGLAVRNKNDALRQILADVGITVNYQPAPESGGSNAGAPAPSAAPSAAPQTK